MRPVAKADDDENNLGYACFHRRIPPSSLIGLFENIGLSWQRAWLFLTSRRHIIRNNFCVYILGGTGIMILFMWYFVGSSSFSKPRHLEGKIPWRRVEKNILWVWICQHEKKQSDKEWRYYLLEVKFFWDLLHVFYEIEKYTFLSISEIVTIVQSLQRTIINILYNFIFTYDIILKRKKK